MSCIYLLQEQRCLLQKPLPCYDCKDKLEINDRKFLSKWVDPLLIIGRNRSPATALLRNFLARGSAFLVGGGPSANELPLELLNHRGIWSMGVNNAAGHTRFRPQAFVCSDPPSKFSHSIWLDPQIMKFVPIPKISGNRGSLRQKLTDGSFRRMRRRASDCPNVWGFQRHSWLYPDDRFFLTDGACWGNHETGSKTTGQPKTVCTMLLGLRLLRFLGARKVYLVGVDFRMGAGYGYSFSQARDADAVVSNNAQFAVVNSWLCEMQKQGVFKRFGMDVYNCFQRSGLRAFSYVPFEDAIAEAAKDVEEIPDLANWYEKPKTIVKEPVA